VNFSRRHRTRTTKYYRLA